MPNGWQGWRKCRRKIIAHAIDLKALAFPMKIMMMRDGGKARLGDKFCYRKTKRQIKWDRDCVLNDENFQVKEMCEFIQPFFEIFLQLVDTARHLRRTDVDGEKILVQLGDLRMCRARFLCDRPTARIRLLIDPVN